MGLLSPQGCPDPAALMEAARQVASALGLQLPNVAGELLLLKCCKELNLPEVRNGAAGGFVTWEEQRCCMRCCSSAARK